jgi:hypothetical protein
MRALIAAAYFVFVGWYLAHTGADRKMVKAAHDAYRALVGEAAEIMLERQALRRAITDGRNTGGA